MLPDCRNKPVQLPVVVVPPNPSTDRAPRMGWVQVLLPVMIYTAGPISGAHFNPLVTPVFMMARMQVRPSLQACHVVLS